MGTEIRHQTGDNMGFQRSIRRKKIAQTCGQQCLADGIGHPGGVSLNCGAANPADGLTRWTKQASLPDGATSDALPAEDPHRTDRQERIRTEEAEHDSAGHGGCPDRR
ncbi:hypothetical protein GCM10027256_27320 [Novispirillum itersonii subsp. nipponicum]